MAKINIIETIRCFYEHVFYLFLLELKRDILNSSTVHPTMSCPSLWYRFMHGPVDSSWLLVSSSKVNKEVHNLK